MFKTQNLNFIIVKSLKRTMRVMRILKKKIPEMKIEKKNSHIVNSDFYKKFDDFLKINKTHKTKVEMR